MTLKNLTRGQRFLAYVYCALFFVMVAVNCAAQIQRDRAVRERDAAISERNTANAIRDSVMTVCKIKFAVEVSP
jgi:hypothetical protein